MGDFKAVLFSLFALILVAQNVYAFSSSGTSDEFKYTINETINYTLAADQNLTSNVTVYLVNSTGYLFNYTSITPNSTNVTVQLNATVPSSGEYLVKANFTFNNTYYESTSIVKILKANSIVISTDKPSYSPGEKINFTVRATDINNIGTANENVTVKFLHSSNDTVVSSSSSVTNSAGEYQGTFTAPSALGSYRIVVNDWVATKIIDVSSFDLVTYTGDLNGNIKSRFSTGDTVFVYMDLFDSNKTRYTGSEAISVQITYPDGTQNSTSYTFSGNKINTSFLTTSIGVHNVKVTVTSSSKSVTLPVEVGKYELVGSLERNTTLTNTFFPNEVVNVRVKVLNVSTGEVIKTTNLDEVFELTLLDSSFRNISSLSNSTVVDTTTGVRTFTFNAKNTTKLYYVKVGLNQSQIILDMKVINTLATSTPVDQNYNFKNAFVGNKQTVRIITTLSNSTLPVNVSNITVASVKTGAGVDITSSITFNSSLIDYKGNKAGLVEFSSPGSAGLYFIKTLANNEFAAETQFLVKLYSACAQLENYRWFVSSNDDANLTVRVTEAKDIGIIDSLAGNTTDDTNAAGNGSGSFSNMYGLHDCYAEYKTTASGESTSGNNTANIAVTVKKILNSLSGEDLTNKVGNLPTNNTDSDGKVVLRLVKPSGGWDGGTYIVELELRDKNNNTDKGFGIFQVKSLWVNIWPKQVNNQWKWYFSPNENMSFDVSAYNSTGTWYYYGQNQGTGDNCTVVGVFYQGNGAEWFWPPKTVSTDKYSWSCKNSTAPANGRFTLNITPSASFDTGYYMIRVKVNTTSGVGDVGEGWFNIKAYNVYVRSLSSNYYDSWYRGSTDNVSIDVDVTYTNSTKWACSWQACPSNERVNETINVSVKLLKYDRNQKEYATSKYAIVMSNNSANGQNTSTMYINATVGHVNLTLVPRGGSSNNSWETGYYAASISVDGPQGKETGSYWFEVRSFFANIQTVKANNTRQTTYTYSSGQNISINVSATNRPNWLSSSSYNVSLTFVPVNITSMKLGYWDPATYLTKSIPIVWSPNSTTNPNPTISSVTTVNVTPLGTLTSGIWYSLETTLTDANGNNQTGWTSFQIKDFTFAARTKNWQWEFSNSENISFNVAVCDSETWWCNFDSNSYGGSDVTATVTKLLKSDSWPYSAVGGWSANASTLTTSNSGKGIVTIDPASTLSGGYYTAELTANTSTVSVTTNVWFRISSFKLSVKVPKWQYTMSENVTLRIGTSTSATLSDVTMTCGYWPSPTYYSISGGSLSANSTSLSSGDNLIMISPSGSNRWTSGYCSGYVTVTSGGESQQVWISFDMKAFDLTVSQPKYSYLKNESVVFKISSGANQYFNISDINITFYNYENNTNILYRIGEQLSSNATGQSFKGSATINLNASGNWSSSGGYSGQIKVIDSNNSAIVQTAWIWFDIRSVLLAYAQPVLPGTSIYYKYNTSSEEISLLVSTFKYNSSKTDWWAYDNVSSVNVTATSIEKQSCDSYPCSYSSVTGWTAPIATSKSDGAAHLNITRTGGWASGWYVVTARLETTDETAVLNRQFGFWVNA
ncbi:MAG: hypothetical protein HYT70_02910 [Candidatus Aenigmarchaeota archaeon]|nr:hypothetical protein [Candidatus Aenigmarchaeota archaeon]